MGLEKRWRGLLLLALTAVALACGWGPRPGKVVKKVVQEVKEEVKDKAGSGDGAWRKMTEEFGFSTGGKRRTALVHRPSGLAADARPPLVLVFHGGSNSSADAIAPHWAEAFDRGVQLVFPNGQVERPQSPSWSSDTPIDLVDVRLTEDLLAALQADFAYDPEQVFAAGFSNGGLQVQMLACFLPRPFRGFAVVHQTLHHHLRDACKPDVFRPLLYVNGTKDDHWGGRDFSLSAMDTVAFWRDQLGCAPAERREALPDRPGDRTSVERWTYPDCRQGFRFMRIEGGGHSWPGSRYEDPDHCTDFSATDEAMRFFADEAGLRPLKP